MRDKRKAKAQMRCRRERLKAADFQTTSGLLRLIENKANRDDILAPWKVAVSGLHRTARFSLIGPVGEKPVLFDDTCYLLSFEDEQEARIVTSILNSPPCQEFLSSLVFTDSKRPITVELLQRLNIHAIAAEAGMADEWAESRSQRVRYPEHSASLQAEFVMERPLKPV